MPTPGTDRLPPSHVLAVTTPPTSKGTGAATPGTTGTKKKPRAAPGVKLPLTYVEWDDHHSNDDWQAEEDFDLAPRVVYSVGWLVKEDDRVIMLATTVDPISVRPYANTITILKATIRKRKLVRASPDRGKP